MFDQQVFGEIYRHEAGRCVATLVRVLGDVDLAEDAVSYTHLTLPTTERV